MSIFPVNQFASNLELTEHNLNLFFQIHRPPDPAAFPDLRASQLPQLSGVSGLVRSVHGVMQHGRKFITSVEIKRSVRE